MPTFIRVYTYAHGIHRDHRDHTPMHIVHIHIHTWDRACTRTYMRKLLRLLQQQVQEVRRFPSQQSIQQDTADQVQMGDRRS